MKQYISLSILFDLITVPNTLTAKSLAQKYEISVRSVYRYLNELESAGVRTFSKVGRNGGVGIKPNMILDTLTLTEEEKQVIKQSLMMFYQGKTPLQYKILADKLHL